MLSTRGNVCAPPRGSIKVELKLTHTNSPKWGSIFVVGEMSSVCNLVECGSRSTGWGTIKVCKEENLGAWLQEKKEGGKIPQRWIWFT